MIMDTISVIVPVYKVEPYLRQCLDSIVWQTYRDLEILLIDDGSPDNCGAICDAYAEQDPRIHVLHKQNAGVHAAWNDGLRMATGDWTAFVDSDDWIELDYFESMLKAPHLNDAQVVQTGGAYYEEEGKRYVQRMVLTPIYFEHGEGRETLVTHTLLRPADHRTKMKIAGIWGKLYQTSFLRQGGFSFDEKMRAGLAGDMLFNVNVFLNASNVSEIPYYGYHYRKTENSGTFRYDPNRPQSQGYVFEQFEKVLCKPAVPEKLTKALESYCLRDIVQNLNRTFFHVQNQSTPREIAEGIKQMKQIPCYHRAIWSGKNPYNGFALTIFKLALRTPFVWPLRLMVSMWNVMDKRENKLA